MWKVVISSNLNSPLKLFFYLPILTNNNLLLKIYCENIVKILWQYFSIRIFYFLYYFSFFHFIFIHTHFISFHFLVFLLHTSVQYPLLSLSPLLLYSFSPQEHSSNHIYFTLEKRESGERLLLIYCPIAGGDRGHRKDKADGDWHSPCSITTSAAPPPLILLPTTRLGQIGFFSFFLFFFSISACFDSTLF